MTASSVVYLSVLGAAVVVWLVVEVAPLSYWRARNIRNRVRHRWRTKHWCRHEAPKDDPPHWVRPIPGMAWSNWRPIRGGGRWRECYVCRIEQRDDAGWRARRRTRTHCFHHDRPGWSQGEVDSRSYIREELIDMGRRKVWECRVAEGGCGRMWFS